MSKDSLGDRMKQNYENAYRFTLPERMPVMLRIDGKAFHSYTEGCDRPFDNKLISAMDQTAKFLCENVQNAMIAYVQSDEISLLLNNYRALNSQSWFNNNLQKIVSVAAGLASGYFTSISDQVFGRIKLATFDCRAFVLPREEVNNAFLFRQQDASRNSVQMLARSLYSHRECTDKNNSELQEMIHQKGKNWNDLPTSQRRGRCIVREQFEKDGAMRSRWIIDNEIPIFSKETNYIDQLVFTTIDQDNDKEPNQNNEEKH